VPSAVAAAATELGLEPILVPERLREEAAVAAVLALEPELIVLADYGQIVPASLLGVRHGALNLHPFAAAPPPWRQSDPGHDPGG